MAKREKDAPKNAAEKEISVLAGGFGAGHGDEPPTTVVTEGDDNASRTA